MVSWSHLKLLKPRGSRKVDMNLRTIQLMPGRRRDLIGLTPLEYTELNWQSSPFGSQSHSSFSGILSCNCSIDFAGVDVRRFYTDKAWTTCVGMPMSFLCISGCSEYCWILLDILIFLFFSGRMPQPHYSDLLKYIEILKRQASGELRPGKARLFKNSHQPSPRNESWWLAHDFEAWPRTIRSIQLQCSSRVCGCQSKSGKLCAGDQGEMSSLLYLKIQLLQIACCTSTVLFFLDKVRLLSVSTAC